MSIQKILEEKKEWRKYMARIKALPQDYQIVYKEIQKYLFKVAPIEQNWGIGMLYGMIELFEEGATAGKGVIEVTGKDVAAFADALIGDADTYMDINQDSVDKQVAKSMQKWTSKISKDRGEQNNGDSY